MISKDLFILRRKDWQHCQFDRWKMESSKMISLFPTLPVRSVLDCLILPSSIGATGETSFSFYLTSLSAIYRMDSPTQTPRLVAGDIKHDEFADGPLGTNRLCGPQSMLLSKDENLLYFCDVANNCFRVFETQHLTVRTLAAGAGNVESFALESGRTVQSTSFVYPQSCDWDRRSGMTPFMGIYILTGDFKPTLCYFDIRTEQLSLTYVFKTMHKPTMIMCLPGSGYVVFTCVRTRCVWVLNPRTSEVRTLVGIQCRSSRRIKCPSNTEICQPGWHGENDPRQVKLLRPYGLVLNGSDLSLFVYDLHLACLFHVPLPSRLLSDA
jgi:hypothetical protein